MTVPVGVIEGKLVVDLSFPLAWASARERKAQGRLCTKETLVAAAACPIYAAVHGFDKYCCIAAEESTIAGAGKKMEMPFVC